MTTDTIQSQPLPAAPGQAEQQLAVLDEQGRRWTATNQARRSGQPYLPAGQS